MNTSPILESPINESIPKDVSEFIILITTSTINVFGFFLLVMQFLFNKREMSTIEFLFTGKNKFMAEPILKPDYNKAIKRFEEIHEAKKGTKEYKEMKLLALLINQ